MTSKQVITGAAIILAIFTLIFVIFVPVKEALPNDCTIHMWETAVSAGGQRNDIDTTLTFENGVAKGGSYVITLISPTANFIQTCRYFLDAGVWKPMETSDNKCSLTADSPITKHELETLIEDEIMIHPSTQSDCSYNKICYEIIE